MEGVTYQSDIIACQFEGCMFENININVAVMKNKFRGVVIAIISWSWKMVSIILPYAPKCHRVEFMEMTRKSMCIFKS